MFGHRTPVKAKRLSQNEEGKKEGIVRRLTGEFEANSSQIEQSPNPPLSSTPNTGINMTRAEKAKTIKKKALTQLSLTRNTKNEIKNEIKTGLQELYNLLIDSENEIKALKNNETSKKKEIGIGKTRQDKERENKEEDDFKADIKNMIQKMFEENNKYMNKQIEEIKTSMKQTLEAGKKTVEEVVQVVRDEAPPIRPKPALRSLVVTSNDPINTAQDVFNEVRKVLRAKEEGLEINSIRKAKDQKIVIGCRNDEIRNKVKAKIKQSANLKVEEATNKKPLVIFKNVLKDNSDGDILDALMTQNQHIFENLNETEKQIDFLFRKRTWNPEMTHVVARVAPLLWNRLTTAAHVYVDLQRVRVEDQSPLVQCSMCLSYGHSKRQCKESEPNCSKCGGSHVRSECDPSNYFCCINCYREDLGKSAHSAFSSECPVRRKWELLTRATIDYII